MVRHVEGGELAGEAQVRVEGEEHLAHEGRDFEVAEEVLEEVAGINVAGVSLPVDGLGAGLDGAVVEDHDFVDAEDSKGTGDATGNGGTALSVDGTVIYRLASLRDV